MKRPVPAQRNGLAKWKVEIGDRVQDVKGSALPVMELFAEWSGNGLSAINR
ncbi:hypothetical protein [Gelidibacter japonicus]|uniref:hypothetical protein n=1 Tax=Gelidibacter japonicus TaxID=1962232 RepID=UPI002AFE1CCE|nr:hypothetical protein [Gelidibacter japonicus]